MKSRICELLSIDYPIFQGAMARISDASLAAAVSEAPAMKTAFQAMKLGFVIYFIPFFFVFNPALILQGDFSETIILFTKCLIGILFLASGLEGYLMRMGVLRVFERVLFFAGGFMIALPVWKFSVIGILLVLFPIAMSMIKKNRSNVVEVESEAG